MTLMLASAALGRIQPVTVSANWGSASDTAPADIASATRTLTVPSGNPGSLHFVVLALSGTPQYSKNGGALQNLLDGADITFANGDTLLFQQTGPTTVDLGMSIDVTDNLRDDVVGDFGTTPT